MTTEAKEAGVVRGAGTALWLQIAERLRELILAGVHPAGRQLPTEQALAKTFGVNRHTVRHALAALAEKGLVRIEQGRGTFVQEAIIDYPVRQRTRFSENIGALGREAGGRLLNIAEVRADAAVAQALALRKGVAVVVIDRLNEVDGRPLSLTSHYFPKSRFPGIGAAYRESGSIARALARCGLADFHRQVTRVTARVARIGDSRLLAQPLNRPILMTESINVDLDGRPVEYTIARWASERVQLVFEPVT